MLRLANKIPRQWNFATRSISIENRKGKLLESVFNVNRVLGDAFETRDVEVLLAAAGAMPIADVHDRD